MHCFPSNTIYKNTYIYITNILTVENVEYNKQFKSLLNKSESGIVNTLLKKV